MEEHHLEVIRTARYCQLGSVSDATKQIWLVCHGYGQLASYFLRHFSAIDDGSRVVVAPEALSRFYSQGFSGRVGASWMTREDRLHEIQDYIRYLDSLWARVVQDSPTRPLKTTVLGFSQGTATAARWAARGEARAERLILWAGGLPPDLTQSDLERLRDLEIVQVVGNADPFANEESLSQQRAFCERNALRVRFITFEGGHELHAPTLVDLAS